jgi:hypothetical protein
MNYCPCCSGQLVRQATRNKIYWFCSRCRVEMPVLSVVRFEVSQKMSSLNSCTNILSQKMLTLVK